ncbi:MAG: DUF465 domain-containing protein, partial [Rickettsiales bacterium]|nr:DUF465 domain-containing protein [Rickettsiales bacterium]
HHAPDVKIAFLKKRKLRLKDKISELERELLSESV